MEKLNKGALTRQFIVREAKEIFNDHGVSLTLADLASKMGVTIGRITNHFRTKDLLIVGLSEAYDIEFKTLTSSFSWEGGIDLFKLASSMAKVMSLQYDYRCLMLFACATGLGSDPVMTEISAKWNRNLDRFKSQLLAFVEAGIMDRTVLLPENFEVLKFQYINLLTTWLVSQTLYDKNKPIGRTKKVYIKGILLTFDRFLTRKGKLELTQVFKTL